MITIATYLARRPAKSSCGVSPRLFVANWLHDRIGDFDEHDVSSHREEDAGTEDVERLLAALDERPEYRPFEAPPVTRQEPGAGCAEVAAVEPSSRNLALVLSELP